MNKNGVVTVYGTDGELVSSEYYRNGVRCGVGLVFDAKGCTVTQYTVKGEILCTHYVDRIKPLSFVEKVKCFFCENCKR